MKNDNENNCPLCHRISAILDKNLKHTYYQCNHCHSIFKDPSQRLNKEAEALRYKKHNNNIEDKNYQQFVSPITSAIMKEFTPNHRGLDFGAGTGPVISKILTDHHFQILKYDPFFHDNPQLLEDKYDYIACCEVIEHFYHPSREFDLLKKILQPNGKLYCMTVMVDQSIDFQNWYYKEDPTHVFFYHQKTMHWIKEKYDFSNVIIEDRLVTFYN